jgi:hypothetical protein
MAVSAPNLWYLLLLLALLQCRVAAQCGSLVTYRQHADLLGSAPRCLRDGCSQGESSNTISSQCLTTSPCFGYWSMFVQQFDPDHSWCSACTGDVACRIQGWPVMNATAMCQSTPNQVLFGQGGCCTQGDEPFELAKWTGVMCNGSEWREQFDICGGMACLDWREWIMPWNWTVHNSSLPTDKTDCKAPSEYLAIYAYEHLAWLLVSFIIGAFRLWLAKHEEHTNLSIFRFLLIVTWANIRSPRNSNTMIKEKLLDEGEHLRPSFTDPLKWGFPVLMGVALAGLQLGFNFWVAHIIKSADGYEEVPLPMLALLFCCRPRLSWLACLLALTPDHWLEKVFKFKHKGDGLWAAKLVLSSVAVSSAVSESIMQLLGAYFLGTTANVGRERGFYFIHHLRPKMWGRDARRMYIGALLWVMLCIPLLVAWFFVALFFAEVFHAVGGWRRSIFNFLKNKDVKVSKSILDYINPDTKTAHSAQPRSEPKDQPREYYIPDQPFQAASEDPFADQPTRYNGPASGSLFNDLPMPVRQDNRRSRYSQLTQHTEFNDQPMRAQHAIISGQREVARGYIQALSLTQRRTASGSQYNALAQAEDTMYRAPSSGYIQSPSMTQRRTTSGSHYNSLAQDDHMDNIETSDDQPLPIPGTSPLGHETTLPSQRNGSGAPLLMPSAHDAPRDSSNPPPSSGGGSSNKRDEYTGTVNWKWQGWESKIIWAGAFLGMLAYAAQWVFWDGFIKTSGDRFCPPRLATIKGIWGAGSFLGKYMYFRYAITESNTNPDVGIPLLTY